MSSRFFGVVLAASATGGCSAEYYRASADREVYSILERPERLAERVGLEYDPSEGQVLGPEAYRVEQVWLEVEEVGELGETEDFDAVPAPEPTGGAPSLEGPGQIEIPGEAAPPARGPLDPPAIEPVPEIRPPPGKEGGAPPEAQETSPGRDSSEDPAGEEPPEAESSPEDPAGETPSDESPGDDLEAERERADATVQTMLETDERTSGIPDVNLPGEGSFVTTIPGARKVPARILSLRDALRLALANNREYQSTRESVYLVTLALTLARHQFAPRFFGVVTGDFTHTADDEEFGSVNSVFGWNQLLASGARLSVSVLNNLFQFFTGNRREVAETIVETTVTQPLLRGFGRSIVLEPLLQASRDVIYQIHMFRRFRRVFAVRVVSQYFRVLQERDRVTNEYNNWRDLVENRARVEEFANAGRVPQLQVDQARQQELQAADAYLGAVQGYENLLDDFKITLGILTTEAIALDPRELDRLLERGVLPLDIRAEDAIDAAMGLRLDLQTSRGQVEDAAREIEVLADALRAQLDIEADVALASGEGGAQKPFRFNSSNLEYGFGFTLDLPLDRKAERNAYVGAIIGFEREKRQLSLLEDSIRLTVREAYRALQREIRSYPIQVASVELARERVTSTSVLQQAGLAETRDVLESQSALINARNALTRSLINYTIARLEFFRDIGALDVDDDGTVEELNLGVISR